MAATSTPTQSTVFSAVRAFILSVITTEVVQGRDNLVDPITEGIVITPLFRTRLSTNSHTYHDPVTTIGTETTTQHVQLSIQVDCYGERAPEWADIISTLWRDEIAATAMGANVQPIDADDPQCLECVDPGDIGYVVRWMVTGLVQVNPAIITPMEFVDTTTDVVFVAADLL